MSRTISQIIGTDHIQHLGLVGVGDLGRALLSYRGFEERGFHISAAFDVSPDKVGRVFAGRRCYPLEKLETVIGDLDIRILVLAARPEGLQEVIDRGVKAGVRSYLNFVPKTLSVPADCFIEHIDISAKLEKLSFLSLQQSAQREAGRAAEVAG
jgi:redox-sensing transcriptional repressor